MRARLQVVAVLAIETIGAGGAVVAVRQAGQTSRNETYKPLVEACETPVCAHDIRTIVVVVLKCETSVTVCADI